MQTNQNQATQSQSDATVQAIMNSANLAAEALTNAGQANMAALVNVQQQSLENNVETAFNVLQVIMDPELPYHLAVLRAAEKINQRHLGKSLPPVKAWQLPKINIHVPEIPTFNSFYQDVEIIQTQLTESNQEAV